MLDSNFLTCDMSRIVHIGRWRGFKFSKLLYSNLLLPLVFLLVASGVLTCCLWGYYLLHVLILLLPLGFLLVPNATRDVLALIMRPFQTFNSEITKDSNQTHIPPSPTTTTTTTTFLLEKNALGKACQCQLPAGRPFRVSFTPSFGRQSISISICISITSMFRYHAMSYHVISGNVMRGCTGIAL